MTPRKWNCTTGVCLYAVMAMSTYAAQNSEGNRHKPKHHMYRLVDLGTLGGPASVLNGGRPPNYPASTILNSRGIMAAVADTAVSDPFAPFYSLDCNVGHIAGRSDVSGLCEICAPGDQKQLHHPFLWKDGVMLDLGLLDTDTEGAAVSINGVDQVAGRTALCTIVKPEAL
jgi:hypothetical protein